MKRLPHKTMAAGALAAIVLVLPVSGVHGQAEIRLQNGSILFGEVKKFEFAKVTLDTDDYGLIEVDWDPITYLKAPGPFSIILADGRTVTGAIWVDSASATIDGPMPMTVQRQDIGSFEDFDVGFWNQFSAGVDVGANFVRGNSKVTAASVGLNLGWETDKTEAYFRASSLTNEQEDAEDTRRYTATIGADHGVLDRLRIGAVANYERDESQDLDYRIPLTVYGAFRAITKQRSRLDIVVGGGPTFEQFTGLDPTSVGEGRAGFSFTGRPNGDTDLDFSTFVIPTLFDFDRLRIESDLVFRIEIVTDLNFNTTAYYRFNDTPPEGIDKSDYGLTFGVGWSH